MQTFTTSDGCAIAYTLRPAPSPGAPRLVLIHSLALDASIWDGVVTRMADHAEILAYDCRGHGQSGRSSSSYTASYTPELFARDLAELLDQVGWQTAAVAGCSMGGMAALAFGGLYPSRASALALIDTTAWYGPDAPKEWRERVSTARSKGFAAMIDFQIPRWFTDRFPAAHPELVSAATQVYLANDIDCFAASCLLLGDADLRPYLASLRMPVAVIVGEEDYATPLPQARQLHEAIQDSTFTIIPGARHLTPIECPEQIASELAALLRR
jgi:3-oxoadipate enol-lactonase